jgi:hypothetical protein
MSHLTEIYHISYRPLMFLSNLPLKRANGKDKSNLISINYNPVTRSLAFCIFALCYWGRFIVYNFCIKSKKAGKTIEGACQLFDLF